MVDINMVDVANTAVNDLTTYARITMETKHFGKSNKYDRWG